MRLYNKLPQITQYRLLFNIWQHIIHLIIDWNYWINYKSLCYYLFLLVLYVYVSDATQSACIPIAALSMAKKYAIATWGIEPTKRNRVEQLL